MRTVFCTLFLLMSLSPFAQVRTGIQVGFNMTNIHYHHSSIKTKYIPRFRLGGIMEIPLEDGWLLNAGLYYTGKGNKHGRTRPKMRIDSVTTRTHYLEFSFMGGYRFDFENGNHFLLHAGLYTGYGFWGKIEYKDDPDRTQTKLHRKEEAFRRIEFGYNAAMAHEWQDKWGLRLEFSNSIINILKPERGPQKNLVFSLTGYWYFRNKK